MGLIRFSTDYRGWTIYELPPNVQGMAALEMLNIMEATPAATEDPQSAPDLHKKIEAMKLAYADLYRYKRRSKIRQGSSQGIALQGVRARAREADQAASRGVQRRRRRAAMSDTTYLAAVDKEGNIASLIQSNFSAFGSGVTVVGMGSRCKIAAACLPSTAIIPTYWRRVKRPFHHHHPRLHEQR